MLPVATKEGVVTPFSDALFTATSAVCVTGLVVHDTATYWSNFGQFIIIAYPDQGPWGGNRGRCFRYPLRAPDRPDAARHDAGGHRCAECGRGRAPDRFYPENCLGGRAVGGAALFPVFWQEFGLVKGLWYALFHSISAFCNAGFDLMGIKGPFRLLWITRTTRWSPLRSRC